MDSELENLWNKLSLSEEEKREVVIEKSSVEETSKGRKNCLIGKLLSKRMVNIEAMRNVLYKVWKLEAGLVIKEVGDRIYVFQFEAEHEKDRILIRQPWSFNKALIMFK